ncbi:hypothetical protein BV898_11579 [Hypsibius exemplaris]|uniref:Cation/H+ exchanger transmembrane domain-containing protein n=1 Tax=Hypsibius exemplaris TaxID=2072580 RepID=A0A1W0WGA2_HYPEX|nr:hypothetical protein BV898_11579 [Hypsibius exemplaris]
MFIMAYTSYILAELFHLSGIISIITCGLLQWQSVCDAVIFLVLGLVIVNDSHIWHTGFVLWTLLLCVVYRFIGVFGLTWLANKLKPDAKSQLEEQFIMRTVDCVVPSRSPWSTCCRKSTSLSARMFVTTTVVIILFTVFVQGTRSGGNKINSRSQWNTVKSFNLRQISPAER